MKIPQYLASGKPLITTPIGDVPRVIRNGKEGILLSENSPKAVADAICTLIKDNELRLEMGRNARQAAERVSSEKNAEKLESPGQ